MRKLLLSLTGTILLHSTQVDASTLLSGTAGVDLGPSLSEESDRVDDDFPYITEEEGKKIGLTREEWTSYIKELDLLRAFSKTVQGKNFKSSEEADEWMEQQNYGGLSEETFIAVGKIIASQVDWNF
jgi:hypothetical protein